MQAVNMPRPVVLLHHEAWRSTMQDGNHRYEALVKTAMLMGRNTRLNHLLVET